MRSKELADLAGVTVRTLRHYHQMGLLPEPPRAENGYRTYGAVDLARVLRIRRLSSLGMSLQQVADMLDAETEGAVAQEDGRDAGQCGGAVDDVLAALDAELAERIEQLQEQRRVIADLREHAIDPDVPPAFGAHIARLREAGASAQVIEAELSGLLLADRLLESDSDEAESIEQFFALLGESGSIKRYAALNEALYGLPADAPESECARLAEQFVSLMVPLLQRGCVRYGWELSQEDIEAMATPPAPMEGGRDARFAQGNSSGSAAGRADESLCAESGDKGRQNDSDAVRADDIFDMYDRETLNRAQHRMSELVVEGILKELSKA